MRSIQLILLLLLFSSVSFAQNTPVTAGSEMALGTEKAIANCALGNSNRMRFCRAEELGNERNHKGTRHGTTI